MGLSKRILLLVASIGICASTANAELVLLEGKMTVTRSDSDESRVEPCTVKLEVAGDRVVGFAGDGFGNLKIPGYFTDCDNPDNTCRGKGVWLFESPLGRFIDNSDYFDSYDFKQSGSVEKLEFNLKGKNKKRVGGTPFGSTETVQFQIKDQVARFRYRMSIGFIYRPFKYDLKCSELRVAN